jgi:peroxiredoxin Q/BCP
MTREPSEVPDFELPAALIVSSKLFSLNRTVVMVFFDARGSEFCRQRLVEFQTINNDLIAKGVQVVGITVDDDLSKMAVWAKEIGVTFPLLTDTDGSICKSFGLLNEQKRASERALVVVKDGKIAFRELVTTTKVPTEVLQLL